MDDRRLDIAWTSGPSDGDAGPRYVCVHDELRYAKGASQVEAMLDGHLNYHWLMSPSEKGLPKVMLEAGINAPAQISAAEGPRRGLIAIRSSPWKAGHESNPWHDEFDLDHGHVRYFGDHKPSTVGFPGATKGNRTLLDAARLHAGTTREERLLAPPLLLFRSVTVRRGGRTLVKGYVEFCGAAIIERLEHVMQRDPKSGRSFPNLALDLAVVAGGEVDGVDVRWIDDRRDEDLSSDPDSQVRRATRWVEMEQVPLVSARSRLSKPKISGRGKAPAG